MAFKFTISGLISLAIGLVVLAVAVPIGIGQLETANTTGWSATTLALWTLTPFVAISAVLWLLVRSAGFGGGKGEM